MIGSPLQRRLLATLLVNARTVVSADRLVDILWRDHAPDDARQALWTCVARLRRRLVQQADATDRELLITQSPGYLMAVDPDQIDAGQFERLVSAATRLGADQAHRAADLLKQALDLWDGAALEEFADEPFATAEAARLAELRLTALEERFEIDLVLGSHAHIIGTLRSFTNAHPLRERPRAQLMLALYRCGRQAEALELFRNYRALLEHELGLEPAAPLCELQMQILRHATDLDWRAPPSGPDASAAPSIGPRSAAASADVLPPELTSFIGREPELAAAAKSLARGRLVTLVGVGGVGKTRLAVRVAAAGSDRFVDGLSWCELAPVTDPTSVAPALATCLGVSREAGASVIDSVVAFLTAKQMLLVLDNCEHVLAGVRPLVADLLRRCPRLVLLATSRERLGVTGEHVQLVNPLPLPTMDDSQRDNPAMALFVDRARTVRPNLELDEANQAQIVGICRQLDGLPLALELAAARLRSLNPTDIAERMGDRFDLLSSAAGVPDRHGTLRAVLDWSYALLSPDQRQLFDQLSVFAGTFDLAAIEATCAGREVGMSQVVDLLTSLVDASMVFVGTTEGTVRYAMLQTLRAYGAEHLRVDGASEAVQLAHAGHFASVAEAADRGLRGEDEALSVVVVDREIDNFRSAHRWMIAHARVDLALPLCRGLRYYMLFRFRDEVVSWGEASLDLPGAEQHPLYAEVCGAVGEGLTARGQLGHALALADGALDRLAARDDQRRMYPLRVAGMVALYAGRMDDGYDRHAEMLRLALKHDQPYEAGVALLGLAQSCTYAGHPDRGLTFAEEQLRVVEPLGNPSMTALAWYDQAEALSSVDPARAIELYQRAVDLADSAGSSFIEGIALVGLASLLGRSGEPAVALPLFRSIIGRWRRMAVWHHQWATLRNLVKLFMRIESWEVAAVLVGATESGTVAAPAFGADAELMRAAMQRLDEVIGAPSRLAARARGAAMSGDDVVAFACAAVDRALEQQEDS